MVFTLSVLQLAAGNKISLNDDISKYLGDIHLQDSNGLSAKATVRQLLSHTAGFGVYGFDEYGYSDKLLTTTQIIFFEPPCIYPKVVQEYILGKHWVYSGDGFMVLQKCIKNISDMPFADFMEKTVLLPLDMTDRTYRQDVTENTTEGYSADFGSDLNGYNLMQEQAAGLWTTTANFAKFGVHLQNILRGKSDLIPQAFVKEMIQPQHDDVLDMENTTCKTGLGCYLKVIHSEAYFGHSGGNYAFESRINFSVQSENGYCVLINTDNIDPMIGKIQDYFLRPA